MKHTLAALLLSLTAASAHAAPAVSYSCIGKNKVTDQSLAFTVTFSEWAPDTSYTYQAVEITREAWEDLETPKVLRLTDSSTEACKAHPESGINFPFPFSMDLTKEGEIADFVVTFKGDCGKGSNYDVRALCVDQ